MKLIFENWKRYLKEGVIPVDFTGKKRTSEPEGPVGELPVGRLPLPRTPNPVQPDIDDLVLQIEEIIGSALEDVFGLSPTDIPIDKYEQLELRTKEVIKRELAEPMQKIKEELATLLDPEHEYKLEEPEGETP